VSARLQCRVAPLGVALVILAILTVTPITSIGISRSHARRVVDRAVFGR